MSDSGVDTQEEPQTNAESNAADLEELLKTSSGAARFIDKQNVHTGETNVFPISEEGGADKYRADMYVNLSQRDYLYTSFLRTFQGQYDERQTNKEAAKWDFYSDLMSTFYVVIFVLLLLTAFLVLVGANTSALGENLPAIISALVGVVTGLIVVPTIIAKYLFNPEEDAQVTKLVLTMQAQDMKNLDPVQTKKVVQDERSSE